MSLKNKIVIITGAGRGIGRAIALKFAADGAKIALAARSVDEINEVAEEISKSGGTAIAIPTDVSDERQVMAMVSRTESELGPVDILINNAAIFLLKQIADTSIDEWNQVMNIDLTGAFLCARTVLASMMERRTGRIINIGSLAGRRGYPEQGAYCAAKHGLVGLSKVLAIEGQPYGIRVNMVSPGGVITDLTSGLRASRGASDNASDWMTAEEVAKGVYYIATQDGPAATDELVLRRFTSDPWR